MTIGGWILFICCAIIVVIPAICIAWVAENKSVSIISLIVGIALTLFIFLGIRWWYTSTEAGQRAFKSQQSNLDGGLYRTVTVYGYSGDKIKSWMGKFDVTENDQETWFDIDGKRVIIQGGIIINEETGGEEERCE